jgi:predicted phage terminase large subunit-like protein
LDSDEAKQATIASAIANGRLPAGRKPDSPEIKAAKAEVRAEERKLARKAIKKARAEVMEAFGVNARGEAFQRVPKPGHKKYENRELAPTKSRALISSEAGERGKRDLWFLAQTVFSRVYPDLVERLHKPMCDFFVEKDPTKDWLVQDYDKNRLLLLPRGHFKTTINLIDTIQWMLAIPNITIALFSGTEELTERMVDEVKQHFLMNGDFREMYPQWCPMKEIARFGEKGHFTVPCRAQIRREPTLSITTLKKTRAGSHYDLMKFDDVITEQNSKTAILNAETKRQWSTTLPLLNPGGYRDVIGTLYTYDCFYAGIIEKPEGWKVMVEGAIEREPDKPLFRAEAILFPERFCVDEDRTAEKQNLEQIWRDDPELFASQYMNDPQSMAADQFSQARLRTHIIERSDIPSTVNLFMAWDLAYSTREHSDFSAGILGGYSPNGTLFIVDLVRGRFRPNEVINKIIETYRKWPVCRVGIEKDQATTMLMPGLEMKQREFGLHIPTDLIPVHYGGMRPMQQIMAMGPLLEQSKLWFCASCTDLEELFREFSRFPKYHHDDICRAVSLMAFYRNHGYRPELAPDPEPVLVHGAQTYGDGEIGAGIVG